MNRIPHIRRFATALAGLASALLAFAVAAPAALAIPLPPRSGQHVRFPPVNPPGWNKHPPLPQAHTVIVHTIPGGGMPGWQITLIAAGAALLAAVLAVLVDRARAARQHIAAPAA
jgi:hypothetical protein